MRDVIERDVFIAAAPERVWEVVTREEHIREWLWDVKAFELRVGGGMTFVGTYKGEAFEYDAVIEHLDPPHAFAFRWAENGWVEGGSTRVEMTLSAEGAGTRLRLQESGFASLEITKERRDWLLGAIGGGWAGKLDFLNDYIAGREVLRPDRLSA